MIGRLNTISPTAEGIVDRNTRPSERASVSRNSAMRPSAALREMAGSVADATATPNSPSGNCMKRNA